MSQSRLASFIEANANLGVGFFLSLAVWHVIGPWFGYDVPLDKNLGITGIFTVVSLGRSYFMRRFFNWLHHK